MPVVETTPVVAAVPVVDNLDDAPSPRHCYVKKWADFTGYGFNLHAEKGKSGHYIGSVDDDSPADLAGLKKGDKIVEVNGKNILEATHSDTVVQIKQNPNEVKMLVVDDTAEEYFKNKGVGVTSCLPSVKFIECPDANPQNGKLYK